MFFARFYLLLLLTGMTAAACLGGGTASSSGESPTPRAADLSVPPPTTYCEKVWSCSYEEILNEEARAAMVQKRKPFIAACEEALRKMPGDFIQKYEHCASKPCGEELRRCLLDTASPRASQ